MKKIRVRVPATSANLGAGFDALGLALSVYNVYEILECRDPGNYTLEVMGEGGGAELRHPDSNLLVRSFEASFREWQRTPPGIHLRALNAIPLARGLGSSASAVVGGVLLANALRRDPLPREALLPFMVRLEGHPDNVVPCCLGGLVVSSWTEGKLDFVRMGPAPRGLALVVAVPEVRLATEDSRRALPETVSLKDAAFGVGNAALFVAAWAQGSLEHFAPAMRDRLHQPFRLKLVPGAEEILEELATCPECAGIALSGSGPSILAFVRRDPNVVASRMCRIFSNHALRSRFFFLEVDSAGAVVTGGDVGCPGTF